MTSTEKGKQKYFDYALKSGKMVTIWKPEFTINNKIPFFYKRGMAIDADGAPNAYHPKDDSKALDYLANAGNPGNWWGIVSVGGKPYEQKAGDPYPGFCVSTTALQNSAMNEKDPRRYVDSTQIPYIVLPPDVQKKTGAVLGDFAVVINGKNMKKSYAIFADIGPLKHLGEGSISLANEIGVPSNPKAGGAKDDLVYVIFPGSGSGNGTIPSLDKINHSSEKYFLEWGGLEQFYSCFPEYSNPSSGDPTDIGGYPRIDAVIYGKKYDSAFIKGDASYICINTVAEDLDLNFEADGDGYAVIKKGDNTSIKVEVIEISAKLFMKVRKLAEILGASVSWNAGAKTVII